MSFSLKNNHLQSFTGRISLWLTLSFCTFSVFSQTEQLVYPKVVAYMGILHPLVTVSDGETTTNFSNYYIVGFPVGINVWKSSKIGFSLEVVSLIRADKDGSKMNNILIHPGLLVGLGKGFTFAGRAAFETSGRYGLTPVLNKTFKTNGLIHYFVAVPLPVRFGNNHPTTTSIGFQFGVVF